MNKQAICIFDLGKNNIKLFETAFSKNHQGFQKIGHKKRGRFRPLIISALQVGLEPTTYGLTVRRSNQLSY